MSSKWKRPILEGLLSLVTAAKVVSILSLKALHLIFIAFMWYVMLVYRVFCIAPLRGGHSWGKTMHEVTMLSVD